MGADRPVEPPSGPTPEAAPVAPTSATERSSGRMWIGWLLALLVIAVVVAVVQAHVVMWLTMRFSLMLSRLLGPGGIMLLTKISGLLLAAIATQLIMEGIFKFIASAQGS